MDSKTETVSDMKTMVQTGFKVSIEVDVQFEDNNCYGFHEVKIEPEFG